MPVAQFHAELLAPMAEAGLHVRINTIPSEIADGIPFDRDRTHGAYATTRIGDPAAAAPVPGDPVGAAGAQALR